MDVKNYEFPAVKGKHILSICDVRSEEAQKLEKHLSGFSQRRIRIMRFRDLKINDAILYYKGPNVIRKIQEKSKKLLHKLWVEYQFYIGLLHRDYLVSQDVVNNITTTVGRSVLAQRLGGDITFTGTVNYTALGDDNTAPVVSDATLGNETVRKLLSSGIDSNNIAYLETFFTATEAVDTHEEYGMYIDGSAGVDTGQLFNRFTQQKIKSNTETMNVQSIITFNDA